PECRARRRRRRFEGGCVARSSEAPREGEGAAGTFNGAGKARSRGRTRPFLNVKANRRSPACQQKIIEGRLVLLVPVLYWGIIVVCQPPENCCPPATRLESKRPAMLTFTTGSHGISRRAFLSVGSLGLGGLTLASLLAGRARAKENPGLVRGK